MAYHLALFVHLLAAFASFAATALQFTAIYRMRTAASLAQLREWSWLYAPIEYGHRAGGALLLLSGLCMEYLRWGWRQGWINVSIAALVLIAFTGASVAGPKLHKLHQLVIAHSRTSFGAGSLPAELTQLLADPLPLRLAAILTGAALGVTYIMVAKPSWGTSLATVAVGAAAGSLIPLTRTAQKRISSAEA